MEKNYKRSNRRTSPAEDLAALSKAAEESLNSIGFGGKKLGLSSEPAGTGAPKEVRNPTDWKPQEERSSPMHDEIVDKIRERNRILSQSIWTDEPVLKPKKSVWLDDDYDTPVTEEKLIPAETANEYAPPEETENDFPVIPITMEKNKKFKQKQEVMVSVAGDVPNVVEKPVESKRVISLSEASLNRRAQERNRQVFTQKKEVTIAVKVKKGQPDQVSDTAEQEAFRAARKAKAAEFAKQMRIVEQAADKETEKENVAESNFTVEETAADAYDKAVKRVEEKKAERLRKNLGEHGFNTHELEFSFVNAALCIITILVIFLCLLFMKRESGFIESENRNLAQMPEFSVSSYFSGDYTEGITEYFTDTVPNRENFKKFCAAFTKCLGVTLDDTVITGSFKTVEKEKLDESVIAATTTVTAYTGKVTSSNTSSVADTSENSLADTSTTTSTTSKTSEEKVVEVPENLDDGQWEGDVIVCGSGENVRALGAYYGTFESGTRYAETINKWKTDLGDGVNVYNMSIPTSAAYYMPNNLKDSVSDQKDNIDNIAANLSGIINADVYDNIGEHTDEYIYSRTDHHWQPLGAYYAGQVFAEKAGVEYPDISSYEKCTIEDFVGTMYAYSNYNQELEDNPDTFYYYKPDNEYTVTYYDTAFRNGVKSTLFFDYAQGVNCYSAILNVDQEIAEIQTDCDNGRVLVIFKDSFGNALVPFLTHGFSKIYVCDFRYFDINAIDFCKQVGCTDLLFAISITSCSTNSKIDCLNNIRIQ